MIIIHEGERLGIYQEPDSEKFQTFQGHVNQCLVSNASQGALWRAARQQQLALQLRPRSWQV
jgi:hypothetical protein